LNHALENVIIFRMFIVFIASNESMLDLFCFVNHASGFVKTLFT
jgi:hypothetical protein